MTRLLIILYVFGHHVVSGQVNPFKLNLQTDKSLIRFYSSSGHSYSYSNYLTSNDTVVEIKGRTNNIDLFLDSLKSNGYTDKSPKNISKDSKWTLEIISHEFLRKDTIYDKFDSVFLTKLKVSLNNIPYKVTKTWTYNLYSNMNSENLKKNIKYCDNNGLVYYTKCKIFAGNIDVSIFTWLVGRHRIFQTGEYYKDQYFK